MTINANEIEARGQNVEQAIESGLARLRLQRDEVTVEVIDEGSRGLLGIGSRDAVVRLISLRQPAKSEMVQPEVVVPKVEEQIVVETPSPQSEAVVVVDVPEEKVETAVSPPQPELNVEEQLVVERDQAVETMQTLLQKMQVNATVSASLSEPDDVTHRRINIIEINGEDLGVLIGPRGETLGSIQYLTRLMVGHKIHDRTNFVIDVEGYRRRREQDVHAIRKHVLKILGHQAPSSLRPTVVGVIVAG